MDELGRRLGRVRRRMALALALREGLPSAAILISLAGAAALLGRRLGGLAAAEVAWLGLLALLAPAWVVWRLRGRWPDRARAAVWLDAQGGGTGWVVAAAERPDPAWAARAARAAPELLPPLEGRGGLGVVLGASCFFAAALLVPLAPPPGASPAVVHPAEALERAAAALEEAVLLPEEQAEALDRSLELLARADPRAESTLEAADAIADELAAVGEAAERAAEAAERALEGGGEPGLALAGAAEALGVGEGSAAGPRPRLDPALEGALADAAGAAGRGQPLEPGPARELSEALREALAESRTTLVEAGLAGEGGEGQAGAGGEGEGEAGQPGAGQGGTARGPGVAPLSFGDESAAEGAAFQSLALPAARYADLERSVLLQEGLAAPEVDPRAEGARGELDGDPGAAAGRRVLSPSQRRVVSGFFGVEDGR